MAVALLSRNRGLTGVRNSKGFVFIILLLSLVYVASSLTNKEKKLKEELWKLEEAINREEAKSKYRSPSKEFEEKIQQFYPLMELMETLSEDFPPLLDLMNAMIRFIEKSKIWFKRREDGFGARMKKT